ncbi:hypothetical protein NECAME_13234 [Necator americanus]|uniref:Uncharacterized protein n=1 Tax=Necator americanus TaxID=51031 RepID=W2SWP4_NECAM|nr:hypothetical protein NECAME_13234 [Necator americanus]ETN74050.1 hypothetical protein NECAME_13234 [Necator americanus]
MLASEAAIEDLMMQAKKAKYDVIGLTETRRRHPLNAVYETGEDLFLGACDSRGVGGAAVLVNTSMANIDSFEQLTTQIGRLWMRRCGQTPVLTIFVAYAPTSNYEEKVEAFYVDLEKFYREDHVFYEAVTPHLASLPSSFLNACPWRQYGPTTKHLPFGLVTKLNLVNIVTFNACAGFLASI